MSDVPSWLTEENINTAAKVASNPAVQKAAKDPAVQQAVVRNIPPPPPPPPKTSVPTAVPVATANPAYDPESATAYVPAPDAHPSAGGGAGHGRASEFVIEEETLKKMQQWHLALRAAYIVSTILMCVASALSLQNQKDLGVIFFAGYVFCFAVMICCFEFALNVCQHLKSLLSPLLSFSLSPLYFSLIECIEDHRH